MSYTIFEDSLMDDGQMERIYENYFCSYQWIQMEHANPRSLKIQNDVGLLHIVPYLIHKKAFVILLKMFDIDLDLFDRLVKHIFHHYPVDTIHVDLVSEKAQPQNSVITQREDDYIVYMPHDIETYRVVLGKHTRGQLTNYFNRLSKTHADYSFELVEKNAITESVVNQIIDLNRKRMLAKNKLSRIGSAYRKKIAEFSKHYGFVGVSRIGDRIIAGAIGYRLGSKLYIQVLAHDDEFNTFRPGFLTIYMTITEAIKRGLTETHLLWGKYDYKSKLGCIPKDLICIKVYKNRHNYLLGKIVISLKTHMIHFIKSIARTCLSFSIRWIRRTPR